MTVDVKRGFEYDESRKKGLLILDIDNVLNTDEHIGQVNEAAGIETRSDFQDYFPDHMDEYLEPELVQRLDECLEALDPDPFIVLCSTWQRYGPGPVQKALEANGFTHKIHQITHEYFIRPDSNRFEEVRSTIRSIDPDRMVILDDSHAFVSEDYADDFTFEAHHVQPEDGLTENHVKKIEELWTVEYVHDERSPYVEDWGDDDE